MPSVRLRVNKQGQETWQVRFRADGTQTSATFDTPKEANRFARTVEQLGGSRALDLLENTSDEHRHIPTLAQWCATHIEMLTGVGESTLNDYRQMARNNLGKLAAMPLNTITRKDIAAWVNATSKQTTRRGTLISGKTIANRHGFISGALNNAVREGIISANPCQGTRLPRTIAHKMTFLTHDEYLTFVGCFPQWRRPLVATMFTTGLRWGEISALQVGDLVIREDGLGTLSVVRAWKNAGKELGPPKTAKSVRTITISPEILEMLKPLAKGRRNKDWLFTARNGRDRVKYHSFQQTHWQRAVALANGEIDSIRDQGSTLKPPATLLGKRPTPHDARHTAASWLLAAGIPINYVQAHLGHESITTTVDRYGHVMPAAGAAIAAAMSEAISGAHPLLLPPGAASA